MTKSRTRIYVGPVLYHMIFLFRKNCEKLFVTKNDNDSTYVDVRLRQKV